MLEIPFNNRFVELGRDFYTETRPTPVASPALIKFNEELATQLGIDFASADAAELAAVFSGNHVPAGAAPVAMAYSGHQFGSFSPQLGDGRAILLGEVCDIDGVYHGLHLKGSGPTAWSRGGDGRAALGPVLREYLVSEAMARLDVPTTRALVAVSTGEEVMRDTPLPGAVITRVATSFVRVGTFQYFAARGDLASVRRLADHVIAQNYPGVTEAENPYLALFEAISDAQARLVARWMQLGFIHGVMNTDNMSVAGETIDYGPCAFMDDYRHDQVYSFIDRQGRYAYNQQPAIAMWNLARLAESIWPLLDEDPDTAGELVNARLAAFRSAYESYWLTGMRDKCGLTGGQPENEDRQLIEDLFALMNTQGADFTLSFVALSRLSSTPSAEDEQFLTCFDHAPAAKNWLARWRQRLQHEAFDDRQRQASMQTVNPVYIPRNHQVEYAIRAAEDNGDFSVFAQLYEVLQRPFEEQAGREVYRLPPEPREVVAQTFCGT